MGGPCAVLPLVAPSPLPHPPAPCQSVPDVDDGKRVQGTAAPSQACIHTLCACGPALHCPDPPDPGPAPPPGTCCQADKVRAFMKEPPRSQKGMPPRPVVGTAVSAAGGAVSWALRGGGAGSEWLSSAGLSCCCAAEAAWHGQGQGGSGAAPWCLSA